MTEQPSLRQRLQVCTCDDRSYSIGCPTHGHPGPDPAGEAVRVIARRIAYNVLHDSEAVGNAWEDYPSIGFTDWQQVTQTVNRQVINDNPSDKDYEAAYELLSDRSSGAEA